MNDGGYKIFIPPFLLIVRNILSKTMDKILRYKKSGLDKILNPLFLFSFTENVGIFSWYIVRVP